MSNAAITFEIATNFDPALVPELAQSSSVTWVYGKLNTDAVGGGRASLVLPRVSWRELEDHVALCHRHGIKFNYLLNSLCLGNREFEKGFHRQLIRVLDRLAAAGVDALTVASPYLLELAKKQYPRFEVSVSDYNRIVTVQQMSYWLELGADEITLYQSVNRDFAKLRAFLLATRGTPARLRIIANNTCVRDCPFHANHGNAAAHASQRGHASQKFNVDYPVIRCTNHKLRHPVQLLASNWIRPEDVGHYQRLCDETGNPNLTIKLVDRSKTTAFLARVARAYHERHYDGNLFDLLNICTDRDRRQTHVGPLLRRAIFGGYNLRTMRTIAATSSLPELYLDNRKLDGFVDRFVAGAACGDRVCDDGAPGASPAGGRCGYCRTWAAKALRVDEEARAAWLAKSDALLEDIRTSELLRFSV